MRSDSITRDRVELASRRPGGSGRHNKDGVGAQRSPMPKTSPLIQIARSDGISPIVTTTRAAGAIGPFTFDVISKTIALRSSKG